ncbi:hypothetical protein ACMDXZ_002806 [Enterococcus faecalis]
MNSQLISIKSTKITCVKTSSINPELNKNYYSLVITFKKLNRPDYVLKSVHELSTSFLWQLIEIDSLEAIIQLASKGDASALLPIYL